MVPFTLLGLIFLRKLLLGVGITQRVADCVTISYALGTSILHYGAAFFGHALVATAAIGAALGIQRALSSESTHQKFLWRVFAGFSGALAFAIEYQAVLICVGVAIAYLSIRENRHIRAILAPALGAALPIGATFIYNIFAFGGPLKTSYGFLHFSYSEDLHTRGLYGITLPSIDAIYGLLFSPSRGLLLCAPVVLVGILAMGSLWRRTRWLGIYVGFCTVGFFLMAAGSSVWFGGWAFGPRLLVPIFGLAAIAAAAGLEEYADSPTFTLAIRIYLAAGIAYNVLITTTFPELPPSITNPLKTVALELYRADSLSPNLGMVVFGLEGLSSAAPLMIMVVLMIAYIINPAQTTVKDGRWPGKIITIAAVTLLCATFAYGHPESSSPSASEKLVNHLASRRLEAR